MTDEERVVDEQKAHADVVQRLDRILQQVERPRHFLDRPIEDAREHGNERLAVERQPVVMRAKAQDPAMRAGSETSEFRKVTVPATIGLLIVAAIALGVGLMTDQYTRVESLVETIIWAVVGIAGSYNISRGVAKSGAKSEVSE